jgi:hypothetical protein
VRVRREGPPPFVGALTADTDVFEAARAMHDVSRTNPRPRWAEALRVTSSRHPTVSVFSYGLRHLAATHTSKSNRVFRRVCIGRRAGAAGLRERRGYEGRADFRSLTASSISGFRPPCRTRMSSHPANAAAGR